MPYTIVRRDEQYCVAKRRPTGRPGALVPGGCHATRTEALQHLAALERATADEKQAKYDHIDFAPSESMREEAQRGLDWRREFGRGGTEVGIARARDIANGRTLSPDTVRRMFSFFARHEDNKTATGFSPGEDGYPSNGRIAWALWGGDPGFAWARARVEQMDAADRDESSKAAQPRRMFLVTSNGYCDRDGETITTAALRSYVESQWRGGEWHGDNFLLFVHKGAPIGKIVFAEMAGPFLVEIAEELLTPYAKRRWDYIASRSDMLWGASHGFDYEKQQKDGSTYHQIEKFETTVLPLSMAANVLTIAGVITEMNGLRKLLFKQQTGMDDEQVEQLTNAFNVVAEALGTLGIEYKQMGENADGENADRDMKQLDVDEVAAVIAEGMAAEMAEDAPDNLVDMARMVAAQIVEMVNAMIEGEAAEMAADYITSPSPDEKALAMEQRQKEIEQREKMTSLLDQLINDTVDDAVAIESLTESYKALEPMADQLLAVMNAVHGLAEDVKRIKAQLKLAPRESQAAIERLAEAMQSGGAAQALETAQKVMENDGYETDPVLGLRLKPQARG